MASEKTVPRELKNNLGYLKYLIIYNIQVEKVGDVVL